MAPSGPMYQAGTLSGNPLAMAAGVATLTALADPALWTRLEQDYRPTREWFERGSALAGVPVWPARIGSMFTLFFTDRPVTDWTSAARSDCDRFGRYFRSMLNHGVYLPPSQFEAAFVSTQHTDLDIDRTIGSPARDGRGCELNRLTSSEAIRLRLPLLGGRPRRSACR